MRLRFLALLTALALALVACSGGGDNDAKDDASGGDDATTSSTASGPTTTVASDPRLEKLVFLTEDFPAGWTGQPSQSTPERAAADKQLATCLGSSDPTTFARFEGMVFGTADSTSQIGSAAALAPDAATYDKDVRAARGDKLNQCLVAVVRERFGGQAGQSSVDIDAANLDVPAHGDLAVGRRLTVKVTVPANGTTPAQSATAYVDFVLMAKNPYELQTTFIGVGAPVDAALQRGILDKLGARLDAA